MLPEEYEDPTREFIRRQGYAATQGLQPDLGLEDTRTGKFGEAVGSVAGGYAPLLLGPAGIPIATGLFTAAGAGEASERARGVGTDEATRSDAALKGAGVGFGEAAILGPFIGPLQKALRPFGVRNRILRAFEQGGIEGAQEAAANTLQNLIQQGYDPTQLLAEGNLEAAGYGAGAGGLIQLMVDLVIPNRRAREATLTDEEKRKAEEAAAKDEGGPDGTQEDGAGLAGDGQGAGEPQPGDVPRSPTGTGASQQQGVGERGETPDLFGDGDGTQPDTLEVVEEFENQALKKEEVLAEHVIPSEADAFEMAAAQAAKNRKVLNEEQEDAAFREAAEFEAEQREAARLQAELEAETQEQTAQQQLEEVEQLSLIHI